MAVYDSDEIVGIFHDNEILCSACYTDEDINNNNIITQKEVDKGERLYFCDQCGERL
jgi:uncharacterized protein YlaI